MITKQAKATRHLRKEKLPPGPRGLDAIRAAALPEEAAAKSAGKRRVSALAWKRGRQRVHVPLGQRSKRQVENEEEHRWAIVEAAYIAGVIHAGQEGTLREILQPTGLHFTGDPMGLQLELAIRRSPVRLRNCGYGLWRVEAR